LDREGNEFREGVGKEVRATRWHTHEGRLTLIATQAKKEVTIATINRAEEGTMEIEIINEPIRFHLHGKSSVVENHCYGEVGLRLMNEMWKAVKDARIQTTGINHWVYFADERMFVGVEVKNAQPSTIPDQLKPFDFELLRYLKHVHIGPYQALPEKWKALKTELAARGETIRYPSLEIYGHPSADPSKTVTTILIGLMPHAQ
jgi:GyrI-like small molecule binding domain